MHGPVHRPARDALAVPLDDCPLLATLITGVTAHTQKDIFTRQDAVASPVAYKVFAVVQGARVTVAAMAFHDLPVPRACRAGVILRLQSSARRTKPQIPIALNNTTAPASAASETPAFMCGICGTKPARSPSLA